MDYIYNISEICRLNGIKDAIICPGSRSAPITLSFARNKGVNTRVIPDERAAAYIALGMAQRTKAPVALVCTSGTAALNFAPAVAEAFYQQIPLLVLTADRPPEWVGQADGQVIQQSGIFGLNVKRTYTLPVDKTSKDSIWAIQRMLNEGIAISKIHPFGPVHINIPLREPLYPVEGEKLEFDPHISVAKHFQVTHSLEKSTWDEIIGIIVKYPKKLIIAGHALPEPDLLVSLNAFLENNPIPTLADLNSNLQSVQSSVRHFDMFLGMDEKLDKDLVPDLIISFGNEFLSKRLKKFIRNHKPKVHIQLLDKEVIVDTFQSITHTVHISPALFFKALNDKTKALSNSDFFKLWTGIDSKMKASLPQFIPKTGFGELESVYKIIQALPKGSILHTSNSLPVRLASIIGSSETLNYCNRGTSGIDGCTSTAVGSALESKELVLLITGDVAFFYDRNGLWHNYLPSNLRILLLNNGGGNIFRTIDGSKDQPELDQYFVTQQKLNAKSTAEEFEMKYLSATSSSELEKGISGFLDKDSKAKLFEIHVDGKETAGILVKLRQNFSQILSA